MKIQNKAEQSVKEVFRTLYILIISTLILLSVLSIGYFSIYAPISQRSLVIYILVTCLFILIISVISGTLVKRWVVRYFFDLFSNVAEESSKSAIEIRKEMDDCIENEKRFNLAMSATKDGLFDINIETGQVYYSPGWKAMLGYGVDELDDDISVWKELTESEGAARALRMWTEIAVDTKPGGSLEFRMKHKDGHWLDILSRAEAVFDENGRTIRIVGTHTDISFRKKIEVELRNKTRELESMLQKTERQRIANLTLLNDFNITTKNLKEEIADHENAELALKNSHNQLRELAQHLQNVREQQSSYIAMEIHDDLGQSLTSLGMILSLLEDKIVKAEISDESVLGFIKELRMELDSTVEKTRQLTRSLRPLILETSDIVEAIAWQVEEFSKITRGDVLFERCEEVIKLDEDRELAVFRLVQEALNNINKHANASEISIIVSCKDNNFNVSIKDNGVGFDISDSRHKNSFGLLNMRERAFFCEGELSVISSIGKGAEIKLSVPIDNMN